MICPHSGRECQFTGCGLDWQYCVNATPQQTFAPIGWRCPDCGCIINPNVQTCPKCSPATATSYGVDYLTKELGK